MIRVGAVAHLSEARTRTRMVEHAFVVDRRVVAPRGPLERRWLEVGELQVVGPDVLGRRGRVACALQALTRGTPAADPLLC